MSKGSALVSILFAFFVGVVVGNSSGGGSGEPVAAATEEAGDEDVKAVEETDGPDRYKVPVTAKQPSKGAKDALVTIVEVSDFQCPFCKRVNPTMDAIMKEYSGKVRVVWRNNPLPFHKDAGPAATLALEAHAQGGDKKFWEAHDKLFENQRALKRADLDKYATELGLDAAKVKQALDSNKYAADMKADQAMAAKLGARGTPAFFINGRFLSGAQPLPKFKEIIEDELKRADKAIKSGVKKSQVYAALTKNGLTAAKAPSPTDNKAKRRPDPNAVYKVPVGKSAVKGKKDALITIVEFSDFQCPFCTRVNPTMTKIQEEYGKDVRIAFKHNALPFHKDAGPAAQAALEARDQGKFWQMHDKLFENQKALKGENLEAYAKEVGLNVAKFKTAMSSEKHKAETEADQKLARSLGASGTPSFFINGRNLRGAQPFEAFKRVIDEELKKAKALVAKGTPKGQLYAKIIEKGATAPKFVGGGADAPTPARPDANKIYKIASNPKAPFKGAKNAKVVIEEFSDFQCPFCGRVNPTIKQVLDEYGTKVRINWRHYPLPFHKDAPLASEASVEVFEQGGSKKFWAFHDLLFENQREIKRDKLEEYAAKVGGINMAKFKAALDSNKHKAVVDADMNAVKAAGARIGTPSFFINGKLLQGAQPFPAFKAAIDAALTAK